MDGLTIRRLQAPGAGEIRQLAEVLVDCVDGGASVSFMHPLAPARAEAFWRDVGRDAAQGRRILLVAENDGGIVGTVQVVVDQPENQPHRADISKMLVHRRARKAGIGARLMQAAEAAARDAGKTLLVLDTADDEAARLYERLGWTLAGVVPDYALLPWGGLCRTSFYYRRLD